MNTKKKLKIDTYNIIRIAAAIVIAFLAACVIIFIVSDDPMNAIYNMFLGPFNTKRTISNIAETAIPLVFTGMAINIAFKAGLFNMGADGSFYMGQSVQHCLQSNVICQISFIRQ